MFERKTETIEQSTWVWSDPDTLNTNGTAFNGKAGPIIIAVVVVIAFALAAII